MQPPSSNSAIWLAQTKLRPPLLRADVVARPRLLAQLRAALVACPVTLLAAPAGYNKTTLLATLVASLSAEFSVLSAELASSDQLKPQNSELKTLVAWPPSTRRTTIRRSSWPRWWPPCARSRRSAGRATLPDRCILALDDLHLLDDPAIYRALDYLLDHLPPQLRLVIATRHNPPLALSRLRARGKSASSAPA